LTANSKHFYFDYKDGKYGYNESSSRGADTFHPFSSGGVPAQEILMTAQRTYASGGYKWFQACIIKEGNFIYVPKDTPVNTMLASQTILSALSVNSDGWHITFKKAGYYLIDGETSINYRAANSSIVYNLQGMAVFITIIYFGTTNPFA